MKLKAKIKEVIKRPRLIWLFVLNRMAKYIKNDEKYLKWHWYIITGRKLDLENPQTFNEKIQWLKLYNRRPEYTNMVDKYEAKKYVEAILGKDYLIPTIGVWEDVNNIDFNSLPDRFVLKTTHDGGGVGVFVVRDRSRLNVEDIKNKIVQSLKTNHYATQREWVYKNINPRIIAEEYKEDETGNLNDYKFFCFNGEPKVLFYASDRYNKKGESPKFDYYDMNLNHLPVKSHGHDNAKNHLKPFPEFEAMKDIARKLSKDIPFVRVDLYKVQGKIYFGELTFYHDSGTVALEPKEWDYTFGSWLNLPDKRYV